MEFCGENNQIALLRAAKEGDADALSALLSAYAPLIEAQVLSARTDADAASELDDLRQEASLALCNAVEHYDESQNVSFGAFAKVCIHHRLVSYQRKKLRHPPTVSLEQFGLLPEGTDLPLPVADPLQALVAKDDFLALCKQIEAVLSPYENRIWWLYVSGYTAPRIAEMLAREERSVQNAIYRIRRKLRAELPNP